MSESRVDEYVRRIQEVKDALEGGGWSKIREDEWQSRSGQTVRFSYAHKEFRIFVKREPRDRAEQHNIHVRDEGRVPTVLEVIEDILELRVNASNTK